MRLIDADKIGLTDFEIIMCQGDYREAFKMLLDKINNQAIVFDVDKVIEELEKLADESYKAYCIAFNSDDRAEYNGKLPEWAESKYAGLFQQYIFYYELNHKER